MPSERATMATGGIQDLIELSFAGLRRMQVDSGLFCVEIRREDGEPRGRSLRYSLMTYIGLVKARRVGYEHDFDLEAIWAALVDNVDSEELGPGDFGLYLWADAVGGSAHRDELLPRLAHRLEAGGGLQSCVGMELAWIVLGLALCSQGVDENSDLLSASLDLLTVHNRAPSGFFYHVGTGWRRRWPNFATEIYSVLALASAAELGLDDRALPAALDAADRLLSHQLQDGGWPWLFDADADRVVERYENYSVHQHAMAPMGLLKLAETSGEPRYRSAALRGLGWIAGRNELGVDMIDRQNQVILRSIRRKPWASRMCLYGTHWVRARSVGLFSGQPGADELNATCRPYELGWLLEAWCGRESSLTSDSTLLRPSEQDDSGR